MPDDVTVHDSSGNIFEDMGMPANRSASRDRDPINEDAGLIERDAFDTRQG